ncbi:MAG: hypothetical protein MOGMAGMI_00198 [Candidatus Omnitrophica bacterium]|nr:hypothetical protein [Candidatus Omnitrophota bacterium]
MTVVESIKKGFSVAAQSLDLVLVLFVFGAGWNVMNLLLSQRFQNPDVAQSVMLIALALIFILVSVYMQAGSMGYVRDRVKAGQASLGSFASAGGHFYLRFLAVGAVVAVTAGIFVLIAALVMGFLGQSLPVVAIPIAVVAFLAGLYFIIMMFLAPYIVVCKEEKAIPAIKQSMDFVKRNILPILGLALILTAAGFVLGVALGALFALITLVVQGTISQILFATLSSAVNAFLGVVVSGAFMAFYLGRSQGSAS